MVRNETPRRSSPETEHLAPTHPLPAVPQQPLFAGLPGDAAPIALQGALPYGAPLQSVLPAPWAVQGVPYAGYPTLAVPPGYVPAPTLAPGFSPYGALGPVPGAVPNAWPPSLAPPGQAITALAPQGIQAAIQDLGREVVATFEVPGVAVEDLQVIVGNTNVSITAQRPAANGRVYQGTFQLPAEVLPSQASARLQHGLLTVTLPRRTPTEEPRRVEVEG